MWTGVDSGDDAKERERKKKKEVAPQVRRFPLVSLAPPPDIAPARNHLSVSHLFPRATLHYPPEGVPLLKLEHFVTPLDVVDAVQRADTVPSTN